MAERPEDVVRAGYDELAERYGAWAADVVDARDEWTARLEARLRARARVLDLGCGSGIPTAARLAVRHAVVGVDVSARQVERAREAVPSGTFLVGDLLTVEPPAPPFDAVVALYSLIHVPQESHGLAFDRVARFLRPGGWFLGALGGTASDAWTGDWLGVPMFFSSPPPERSLELLETAGLRAVESEVVTAHEPEGDVPFLWVLAQRER